MSRCLTIVLAHAEAQATFNRHLTFWASHGWPILVVSPEDARVRTGCRTFLTGQGSHGGAAAGLRFRELWKHAYERYPAENYVFYEYDSISLSPTLPGECFIKGGFWGLRFPNNDTRFRADHYFHPPYFYDRQSLGRWLGHCNDFDPGDEQGMTDRQQATILDAAGIDQHSWGAHAFSENTILPGAKLARAIACAREGATLFHGIKHPDVLQSILHAHDARRFPNARPIGS